jgi:hypothetical protein
MVGKCGQFPNSSILKLEVNELQKVLAIAVLKRYYYQATALYRKYMS